MCFGSISQYLIHDSVEEPSEFDYSVNANLNLFSLPFTSNPQSYLPEISCKYLDNREASGSALVLEGCWLNLEHPKWRTRKIMVMPFSLD